METEYDWIIVGSGFGGSVCALRLVEKGYRVAVFEKGKRFAPGDFAKTNWDLRRWMWMPSLGCEGIFRLSFLKHLTVLHGIGVGGGSLTYTNALPMPKAGFFASPAWAHLANWETELAPHYATARSMVGVAPNPRESIADRVFRQIAEDIGRASRFQMAEVGVYFGEPGRTVAHPYFGGAGPARTGCTFCGACMTGCRVGAKNTLDRNYLFLAEKGGATIFPRTEVVAVRPFPGGYAVEVREASGVRRTVRAARVIFAGGVMGTLRLLLRMREDPSALPKLSARVGDFVRTNSDAMIGVVAPGESDLSSGVAITSVLETDEHSHLEPVRFGAGSGFFRLLMLPHRTEATGAMRIAGVLRSFVEHPWRWLRTYAVRDFARHTQLLLYMRAVEGCLSLRLGRSVYTGFRRDLVSRLDDPKAGPAAFFPEATELARRFAEKVGGTTVSLGTEVLLGTPSTPHILGGACMGEDASQGVVDRDHRVFGYDGLYVVDGSSVSANPGVNPSLTITALAERAMHAVPKK